MDLCRVDLRVAKRVPPVPLERIARAELSRRDEAPGALARLLPHEMIGRDIERVPGFGVDTQHLADPVGLDRDHARNALRVVHLGPDGIVFDKLSDRDETGRGADQRVIGLTSGDLFFPLRPPADVEPHRRVEGGLLGNEQVHELVLKHLGLGFVAEVAPAQALLGVAVGDPVDHLLDGALAPGGPGRAAEVLLGGDIGGVLRPLLGDLHVLLLERHLTRPIVADDRIPQLPLDIVVGVPSCSRKTARQHEFVRGRDLRVRSLRHAPYPFPTDAQRASGRLQ